MNKFTIYSLVLYTLYYYIIINLLVWSIVLQMPLPAQQTQGEVGRLRRLQAQEKKEEVPNGWSQLREGKKRGKLSETGQSLYKG